MKNEKQVFKDVVVHYMAESPHGPIATKRKEVSDQGMSFVLVKGGNYAVACQPFRKNLSRMTPGGKILEVFLATGDPAFVTCPKCRSAKLFLRDVPKVPASVPA